MRRSALIAGSAAILSILIAAHSGATARADESRPEVWAVLRPARPAPGDVVNVEIRARGVRGAGSLSFHLVYDPTIFEPVATGHVEGKLLRQGGARTSFMTGTASTGERVMVGLTRLGSVPGARGSGLICRLSFRALAAGSTAFVFDRARLSAPDATDLGASFTPARAVVAGPAHAAGGR